MREYREYQNKLAEVETEGGCGDDQIRLNPGYRLDRLLGMHFASDLGGGVEIFPTRNSLIRVDAGTVLTRIVRFQAVGDLSRPHGQGTLPCPSHSAFASENRKGGRIA